MINWKSVFPEEDRKIYEKGGFMASQQPGKKPALLIIDMVESFTGSRRMSIEEAQKEFHTSCGEVAWEAIDNIKVLLAKFRESNLPVLFVKGNPMDRYFCGIAVKPHKGKKAATLSDDSPIVGEIAPLEQEYVLEKAKASAFFGTPLVSYLVKNDIDTLYIVGTTTSGCIRASVIDAFSYGYKVFVVEECVFDRSQFSHMINLYEMNAKYADVVSIDNIVRKISNA